MFYCERLRGHVAYLSRKVADRVSRERQDVKREVQSIPLVLDDVLEGWPGRGTLRTGQINEDIDLRWNGRSSRNDHGTLFDKKILGNSRNCWNFCRHTKVCLPLRLFRA